MREGDALLLIEDAVYAASDELLRGHAAAALESDVAARGVSLPAHITVRDYDGFVEWVAGHDNSVTWT